MTQYILEQRSVDFPFTLRTQEIIFLKSQPTKKMMVQK